MESGNHKKVLFYWNFASIIHATEVLVVVVVVVDGVGFGYTGYFNTEQENSLLQYLNSKQNLSNVLAAFQ